GMSEIDRYLRELRGVIPRRWRRRFLSEAGSHLQADAAELRRHGLPWDEAEARAVASFGTPAEVAAAIRLEWTGRPSRAALPPRRLVHPRVNNTDVIHFDPCDYLR